MWERRRLCLLSHPLRFERNLGRAEMTREYRRRALILASLIAGGSVPKAPVPPCLPRRTSAFDIGHIGSAMKCVDDAKPVLVFR